MPVNVRVVGSILGMLVASLGAALLLPMLVGLLYGEASWWAFGVAALIAGVGGGAAWYGLREGPGREPDVRVREGIAIVALAWFVLSLIGALPFVLGGVLDSYTDAFFETMSGFTTTGATILGGAETPAIEAIPRAFLFWRSLAHWLGGMGIIVLTLAILPILGVGGMQLYKAEVPGPSADKLTPRVRETAKRLWLLYVAFTFVEILLLWPAMGLFDAVNHAFATMATGGFSTQNGSVADFDSAYIDWVITVFMIFAGINFALHYRLYKGPRRRVWEDVELRAYLGILLAATVLILVSTWRVTGAPLWPTTTVEGELLSYDGFWEALRYAAFQAAAIVTTTGFGTADYEIWPPLAVAVIFLLFFCGGMAGSTGGGVKVIRNVLLFKNSFKELKQLVHPRAILPIRLGDQAVSADVMRNVLTFIVLYFGLIGLGTLVMSGLGLDLLSAFSAAFSSVGNVGPAFGTLGPTENYAHIPAFGKWFLALLMMAGRLEVFTVLVLFAPTYWQR